jgi:hypothetical protein
VGRSAAGSTPAGPAGALAHCCSGDLQPAATTTHTLLLALCCALQADVFSFAIMTYEVLQRYIMLSAVAVTGTYSELEAYCARMAAGYRPPLHAQWPPRLSKLIQVGLVCGQRGSARAAVSWLRRRHPRLTGAPGTPAALAPHCARATGLLGARPRRAAHHGRGRDAPGGDPGVRRHGRAGCGAARLLRHLLTRAPPHGSSGGGALSMRPMWCGQQWLLGAAPWLPSTHPCDGRSALRLAVVAHVRNRWLFFWCACTALVVSHA